MGEAVTVLVVLEAFAIALLGVLVVSLLRSHAEILRALHDLGAGIGDPSAPDTVRPRPANGTAPVLAITGPTLDGESVSISLTGRRRPTLLAFLSSGCLTCRTFWDTFAGTDLDIVGGARLVIVAQDPDRESASALRNLVPRGVTTVLSSEAWQNYAVPGSPYFILVDATGATIGEGTGRTWAQVHALLSQALADADPDAGAAGSRVDRALRAAGIGPEHESLRPNG